MPLGTRAPRRPNEAGSRRNDDHLLQFIFRLVDASNIFECDLRISFYVDLGPDLPIAMRPPRPCRSAIRRNPYIQSK